MRRCTIPSVKLPAFIRCAGLLGTFLFAGTISAAALEPNDLVPGMGKAAAVSVYTGHRSCGNYEFREEPDTIGWDASLYGRPARVDIQFEENTATSILIVLFLEAGDDGGRLFENLVQERIRDFGYPLPRAPGSNRPDTVVWVQDDHLVSLERWPMVPAGEIHITRSFQW